MYLKLIQNKVLISISLNLGSLELQNLEPSVYTSYEL